MSKIVIVILSFLVGLYIYDFYRFKIIKVEEKGYNNYYITMFLQTDDSFEQDAIDMCKRAMSEQEIENISFSSNGNKTKREVFSKIIKIPDTTNTYNCILKHEKNNNNTFYKYSITFEKIDKTEII
jgi:hypothetical protein